MYKRSLRRHHYIRIKNKRRTYWWNNVESPREGFVVDTPTPCSCYMCGNPRKYFKEKTLQEKKFDLENISLLE